ncbi:MAG TPA: hypothetical protein VGD04_08265 [Methylophilus sp.]
MSLLWPNQLLVVLSNEHVAVLYRSGFTKRVIHQQAISITQGGWQACLTQLQADLSNLQIESGTQLSISLASDLVRYMVLPAQAIFMSAADKRAYARAAFVDMFGTAVADWQISCDDAPPHQPTIAAAMDTALYNALQQLAAQQHAILSTLQPYAATVLNRCSERIGNQDALLAIVEHKRLLLIQLSRGRCQQIRSHKTAGDWQHTLQEILARARMLDAPTTQTVFVYAPLHTGALMTSAQGWQLKKIALANPSKPSSASLAMLEALA